MVAKISRRSEDLDPLSKALQEEMSNETQPEREARLEAEIEAKKVSDSIDEDLNRQKLAAQKKDKPVKILLLGQSESGKSTTLKNFQLMNSPKAFREERAGWRAVIQLNVVRSVRLILDAMTEAPQTISPPSSSTRRPATPSSNVRYPALSPELMTLKMRLSPLMQIEEVLIRALAPSGSPESTVSHLTPLTNLPYAERSQTVTKELTVNSALPWKGAFTRMISSTTTTRGSFDSERAIDFNDPNDPGVVLNACAADIAKLWSDPVIKSLLDMTKLRMQEMAGFFLDDLERVTALRYVPTDDDILKARLKTLGVSEHRFEMRVGHVTSSDWLVYDVGGHRSLRAAWVPFFDDLDAIIFLAPISCFDLCLTEDPRINRLEDSFLLWKSIVKNPLLSRTNLVLFLNKIDILKAKLKSGIRLADFVTSYGDRPNDYENTSAYLKKKFHIIFRDQSKALAEKDPSAPVRPFYCHFTAVTDTRQTKLLLANVQDMCVRASLQSSSLM